MVYKRKTTPCKRKTPKPERKKRPSTTIMWDALESQLKAKSRDTTPTFPKQFLIGLRLSLESGLNCQQITSLLLIQSSLFGMMKNYDEKTLVVKTLQVLATMKKDVETEALRVTRGIDDGDWEDDWGDGLD